MNKKQINKNSTYKSLIFNKSLSYQNILNQIHQKSIQEFVLTNLLLNQKLEVKYHYEKNN